MHRGDGHAVAGDADEARLAGVARFDGRLERAARRHRRLPLRFVDEIVELHQVDVVRLQPLQRLLDLRAGAVARALIGLRRQEEAAAMLGHPLTDASLGAPVRGGGVDVVDAVAEQQVERRRGFVHFLHAP